MMNRYCIYFFLSCLLLAGKPTSYAQGENNHWYFGLGHHLNFNANPPAYTPNTSIATFESSAAVSDAQGNLLFYTIGCRIWDRNGNEMPNATGLFGNYPGNPIAGNKGSGQDCVQTLPNPANKNQYYVFSANAWEELSDTIFYHIVDMSLNGGLGDVVPSSKNTILFAGTAPYSITEFMTVAYADCNNYWYIVTMGAPYNYAYYAYKVDENGVSSTPVVSVPTVTTGYNIVHGLTKILPLSQKAYRTSQSGLIRSDFNKYTGQFTNFELIPGINSLRFEFSPNEQLLYIINPLGLQQMNMALYPNVTAIANSGVIIGVGGNGSDLRLGPDGKIYRASTSNSALGRIELPNVLGTGCTYTPAYAVTTSQTQLMRLGAKALRRTSIDTIINPYPIQEQVLCKGDTLTISSPHSNMDTYLWDNSSTARNRLVTQIGKFWVQSLSDQCQLYVDTFEVTIMPPPQLLPDDTSICLGDSLIISALHPRLDTYVWNEGSTTPAITVHTAGTYSVVASSRYCTFTDTIAINGITPEINILQADTLICTGSNLLLEATTNMSSSLYWSNGASGNATVVQGPGVFKVYTDNVCGTQSDSITVSGMDCNCRPIVPNAFTPNNDGRNDVFMPVFNPDCAALHYELSIYNRYGQLVYKTNRMDSGWNGKYQNNQPADAGVYFYLISMTDRYGGTDKQLLKGDITLVR